MRDHWRRLRRARQRVGRSRWWRVLRWVIYASIIGGAVLLRLYVPQPGMVVSSSMAPTLRTGDFVCVSRRAYRHGAPRVGDIVAFYSLDRQQTWMKRVVAGPGDWVGIRDDILIRNGRPVNEPYIRLAGPAPSWLNLGEGNDEESLPAYVGPNTPAVRVPPGHAFVLGDNRRASDDSRHWGPLRTDLLLGRAVCIYWPPRRWRRLDANPRR